MARLLSHDPARFNFLFRAGILWFAIATYVGGATTLVFGTLLSALCMTYRWLSDGVWPSYTLADLLLGDSSSESGFFQTPLLVAMPLIGGILTAAGTAMFVSLFIGAAKPYTKSAANLESDEV